MPRDEDDDDHPRPRRRRDDDDEDDRPRSRRRDDEDDADDRPRRRGRRDRDEDDDWDRPRRKKKGGSGLVIALVVGGVLLLVCGGGGVALLLPAVQKVREAAARAKDMNNLKESMVGVFGHIDSKGTIPPATGNLSWRVHILPYIDQQPLYGQFDLNQPWDGPKNRPLADTAVKAYTSALDQPDGQTRYRVFTGPGTLYDPVKPVRRVADVTDGTPNTIFAVEAADTVPWTQPRELPFTPNGPLPQLGHPNRRDIVLVAMMDGSVRAVHKKDLDPSVLRALITPAGGERAAPPE